MKLVYFEEQRFTQWWLWLILGSIALLPVYGIFQQLILGKTFGNHPMSDFGLIIFALLIFGFIYFIAQLKLTTEINQEEIRINFSPLASKKINWNEIKTARIVDYGFVGG